MKTLPRAATVYLQFIYTAGAVALLIALWTLTQLIREDALSPIWAHLLLFLLLGGAVGPKKVRLTRSLSTDDVGSLSLGFTISFATMLHFGPAAAVLVACVNCLVSCLSQPAYQRWFNVAMTVVEVTASGLVLTLFQVPSWQLSLSKPTLSLAHLPAVLIGSLVYYAVNTGGVSMVISLSSRQNIFTLWKENFLWTLPSYLAGGSASGLALYLMGKNDNLLSIMLVIGPVGYLTYMIYETYTGRTRDKEQHIEELQTSQAQLADLYLATIKSLALAIDAKNQYTHQHILRVQRYAVALGQRMNLSESDLEGLRTGALLHDIGKLGVPEYVLLKPGKLTPEEFTKIKKHPEIGAAILDPVEFPWPVLPVVKYHHEKWDGTGYPEGLKGEEIPLMARILSVADVYDALTSTRSYRNAWSHEKAINLIREDAGTHFDPAIAQTFLEVIEEVVKEMAAEGYGPLVSHAVAPVYATKADEAARDIHRASADLWALYEVAQSLSASMGITETLEILARKLEAILPGVACLFLLRESDTSEALVARAAVGCNREHFANCRTASAQSRSLTVVRTRETYLGEFDYDDLLIASIPQAEWVPLSTALIVPIVHQGEALGTINLFHQQTRAFSPHDQHLLEMIAERAAMAIYNGLLYDRTRNHAFTDPLTELYNLRFLTQYVEKRCEEGKDSRRFAVLCLDLDNFKPVNDNFGHLRGDDVLRDLAGLLRSSVKEGDIVSRYGGDEFLLVLEDAGLAEAVQIGERVRTAVTSYDPGLMHPRLGALRLGVSIGTACFPHDGEDCTMLLSAADQRMYQDKTDRKLRLMAERQTPPEWTREAPEVVATKKAA